MTATIWYFDEENYRRFKEVCDDGHELPDTYAAWLAIATEKMAAVERSKGVVNKIKADPDDFVLWCKSNGVPTNKLGRVRYATARALAGGHSVA